MRTDFANMNRTISKPPDDFQGSHTIQWELTGAVLGENLIKNDVSDLLLHTYSLRYEIQLTLFYMGGGQNCPPNRFLQGFWETAMNKPPVFCNFSQNLSEHLESKCRPRWPTGSPDTRWILEATQCGQNCPPCEISRFCLQNRCYTC